MNIENEREAVIFNKGVKTGQEHAKPSIETMKTFTNMEKQINEIKIKTMEQQKDIEYIKVAVDQNNVTMKEFIKCADIKYANKWTEKMLIAILSLFGIAIIGTFIQLTIK